MSRQNEKEGIPQLLLAKYKCSSLHHDLSAFHNFKWTRDVVNVFISGDSGLLYPPCNYRSISVQSLREWDTAESLEQQDLVSDSNMIVR